MQPVNISTSIALRHVESDFERRVQIAFSIAPSKIQAFLPRSWEAASLPPGPSEGANLLIVFRNRLHTVYHHGVGKAELGEQDKGVIVLVQGRHVDSGEVGLWVVRSLAANVRSIPGPYGNSKPATVHMEQRIASGDAGGGLGIESWRICDEVGHELTMYLHYRAGVPIQSTSHLTMRGGHDPGIRRVYHTDKGADMVRSVPTAIDRVLEFHLKSTLTEFAEVFDGNEKLVSIAVEPWYMRRVLVPNEREVDT
ncbi:hypothetical protein [Bradyrhizobium erythrophlei]|uniref:Acetoacetate decarboxylase (ADC) n=1 Tax=Bradyrhizobium erythrophlei TaxID=1437360 RepID=A0A1H4WVM1_9BRAD|nr:hypothetical protein [Bradyrhizobium erythrophlei]SEC97407.1 hypothetical protein SAMN05444164_3266 [Bradyrhizobium erythrophlei]